jgi:hypothetical protein
MPAETVSNRSVVILVTVSALVVSLAMMIWGGERVVGQPDIRPVDPEAMRSDDTVSVPYEAHRSGSLPDRP